MSDFTKFNSDQFDVGVEFDMKAYEKAMESLQKSMDLAKAMKPTFDLLPVQAEFSKRPKVNFTVNPTGRNHLYDMYSRIHGLPAKEKRMVLVDIECTPKIRMAEVVSSSFKQMGISLEDLEKYMVKLASGGASFSEIIIDSYGEPNEPGDPKRSFFGRSENVDKSLTYGKQQAQIWANKPDHKIKRKLK